MRLAYLTLAVAVLLGACAAPGSSVPSPSPSPSPMPSPSSASSAAAWELLDAGTFEIEFPGKPMDIPQGEYHLFQLGETADPVVYQAAAVEFDPDVVAAAGVEGTFDRFQAGMLEGTTQEVVSQEPVKVDGVPGRRLVIRHARGAVEVRLYLQGSRMFFQQVIAAPGYPADPARFFSSFRVH